MLSGTSPCSCNTASATTSIATGLSDHEVGAQLKISPETVGTHRRNASRKLNIFNDRKLMQYAREQGLDFSVNQLPAKGTGQPAHRKKTT